MRQPYEMDEASALPRGFREPDRRALQILFDTFWSPAGWRSDPLTHVTPEDLRYAIEHGVMFEPVHLTHDGAVAEAIAAHAAVTGRQVAGAFAYSLASRRLDLRSGLGSYAATTHLREHRYVPYGGRGPTCEVCGFYDNVDVDLNVLSFERFKWGGVRHLKIDYAAFDLRQFRLWADEPDHVELQTLEQLLDRWRSLTPGARAQHAADAARGLVPSNNSERTTLVGISAIAGVLQPASLPSMILEYVSDSERNRVHPGGRNDWDYPAFRWRGTDGVNEAAVAAWWGSAVARP